jgi:hypothetical protein
MFRYLEKGTWTVKTHTTFQWLAFTSICRQLSLYWLMLDGEASIWSALDLIKINIKILQFNKNQLKTELQLTPYYIYFQHCPRFSEWIWSWPLQHDTDMQNRSNYQKVLKVQEWKLTFTLRLRNSFPWLDLKNFRLAHVCL